MHDKAKADRKRMENKGHKGVEFVYANVSELITILHNWNNTLKY